MKKTEWEQMTKKPRRKRVVVGDYVISKTDYERHYVNARRLCELYRFNPKECILIERGNPDGSYNERLFEKTIRENRGLPVYSVRFDGNYTIEEID